MNADSLAERYFKGHPKLTLLVCFRPSHLFLIYSLKLTLHDTVVLGPIKAEKCDVSLELDL